MFTVLRFVFDLWCILFLWNGIKISSSGEEILFISGALFRYAVLCDFIYFLLSSLFPIKKKCFDE